MRLVCVLRKGKNSEYFESLRISGLFSNLPIFPCTLLILNLTNVLQAAAGAVRLDGDVITANGSIISGHIPHERPSSLSGSLTSVCSCRCPKCPIPFRRRDRPPRRLTLTKSPAKITHLQPFERKSVSVAVYHRHPSAQVEVSSTSNAQGRGGQGEGAHYQAASGFSSHYHGHIMPSESFDLSPSRSPSPILELFDSPPLRHSEKRMSV